MTRFRAQVEQNIDRLAILNRSTTADIASID